MISINGKQYEVIEATTPHQMRDMGKPNTANQMIKSKIEQVLVVKPVRGKTFYQVSQYKNGNFGKMIKAA